MKTLREGANLSAGGAWVASAGVRLDDGARAALLLFAYARGAAGGACAVRVELSADGSHWHFLAYLDDGALADGVVPLEPLTVKVASVDALARRLAYPVEVAGARWIRVSAAEVGAVGTPGALEVTMGAA